jgi:hypothetical protein
MIRLAMVLLFWTGAAQAQDFQPVRDKAQFLDLIEGRNLRHGFYGIDLTITPQGQITGSALGWPVTGQWQWKDGWFCRDMDWSGTPIPYNCQLVEAKGEDVLRFTVDQGAGDSAQFRLR